MAKPDGMITSVIFDLGRVLVDFDHTIAAKRISAYCAKSPLEIYELFFDSKITALFEAGTVSFRDFYEEVKSMLDLRLSFEGFIPIWNEIFLVSPENKATRALALTLTHRYTVAILSNINVLHYEYIKSTYDIFSGFHQVFLSCEMQAVKPQRRIYEKALEVMGAAPENTFYTDDRPELIAAARELGIRGYVYRGIEQLSVDLGECGVTVDAQ